VSHFLTDTRYCNGHHDGPDILLGLMLHTRREQEKGAPEEDWNAWRDKTFASEFGHIWLALIHYWKNQTDYGIAFYLPFERLTDIETGRQLLSKLADVATSLLRICDGSRKAGRTPHDPDCLQRMYSKEKYGETRKALLSRRLIIIYSGWSCFLSYCSFSYSLTYFFV